MRPFAEGDREDRGRRRFRPTEAKLPFGYWARREGWLLVVRRPDGGFVAAFVAEEADPFEVEAAVWGDAD